MGLREILSNIFGGSNTFNFPSKEDVLEGQRKQAIKSGFAHPISSYLPSSGNAVRAQQPRQQTRQQPTQAPPTPTPTLNPRTPKELESVIREAATQYGIPPGQFSNLLARESMGFNPSVLSGQLNSPVGARGVAQFMPDTAAWWAKSHGQFDPLVPEEAIPAAAHYLQYLNNQFGDWPSTYGAYNWGEGSMRNALSRYGDFQSAIPYLPQETRQYVPAVMSQDYPY